MQPIGSILRQVAPEHLFHKFPRALVTEGHWAEAPMSAKVIWPTLAAFSNAKGVSWPSQDKIAEAAGVARDTARRGIMEAATCFGPYLRIKKARTKRGYFRHEYRILCDDSAKYVPLYHGIIKSAEWKRTSGAGRALYPVLRVSGGFNIEDYANPSEFPEVFPDRLFDTLTPNISKLAMLTGIRRQAVYSGLRSLFQNNLIQPDPDQPGVIRIMIRQPNKGV